MKKCLLFNIFFFIVTCCYSISISVPQISTNNDLDSIFDVNLESFKFLDDYLNHYEQLMIDV